MSIQADDWIGRFLNGRYRVDAKIGEGGMGIVFRGHQESVGRPVAIKMLRNKGGHSPETLLRFRKEAQACSLLNHPNTVRLYDFGATKDGTLYMVMELLVGQPLSQVLQKQGPLPVPRALRILRQCAASLCEAHQMGIIHRDVKPDNIFLTQVAGSSDYVKLLDFSVAKVNTSSVTTAAGMVFGTPQYMSFEQAAGYAVDCRTDIYSLGVVGYQMLSNSLPFDARDPMELLELQRTFNIPPLPTSVPNDVQKCILSCLTKSADDRLESATALLETISPCLKRHGRMTSSDLAKSEAYGRTIPTQKPSHIPAPSPATSSRTMLGTGALAKESRSKEENTGNTTISMEAAQPPKPLIPPTVALQPKEPARREKPTVSAPRPAEKPAQVHSARAVPPSHRRDEPATSANKTPMAKAEATEPPSTEPRGLAFVLLCTAVAIAFGLGGYYFVYAVW